MSVFTSSRAVLVFVACLAAGTAGGQVPEQIMRPGYEPTPVQEAIEARFASGNELDAELPTLLAGGRTADTERAFAIITALIEGGESARACARLPALIAAYRRTIESGATQALAGRRNARIDYFLRLGRIVQLGEIARDLCSANRPEAIEVDVAWAREQLSAAVDALAGQGLVAPAELVGNLMDVADRFLPSNVFGLLPVDIARASAIREMVRQGHRWGGEVRQELLSVDAGELFASAMNALLNRGAAEALTVEFASRALIAIMSVDAIRGRADAVYQNAGRLRAILTRVRRDGEGGLPNAAWECQVSTLELLVRLGPSTRPARPPACRGDWQYLYQETAARIFYGRLLAAPEAERRRSLLPLFITPILADIAIGVPTAPDPFREDADIVARLLNAERAARAGDTDENRFRSLGLGMEAVTENAILSASMENIATLRGAGPIYREFRALRELRFSSGEPAQVLPSSLPPPPPLVAGSGEVTLPLEDLPARQRRFDTLRRRLEREVPEFAQLTSGAPVRLQQVQAVLRPDELLLLVVTTPFGTQTMAVSATEIRSGVSGWGLARMRRAVDRLRWDLGASAVPEPSNTYSRWLDQSDGGRAFARSLAHDIYRETIGPVEAMLEGKNRLIVISSGPLTTLPFSVLVRRAPTGSDSDPAALRATPWLGDRVAISQLDSIFSFLLMRQRPVAVTPAGHQFTFVGVGDPVTYGRDLLCNNDRGVARSVAGELRSASQGFTNPHLLIRMLPRLRCTAVELDAMARMLQAPRSILLKAENATEARFRHTDISSADLIHFATHGLVGDFVGLRVTESALVLTPPSDGVDPPSDNDGFLLASDISQLRLRAQIVILSTCNSGQGEDIDSPPLGGLARAFLNAGARNLMVSFWPVNDRVGPLLTVEAVRLLRASEGRLTASEALQQAMRSLRNNTSIDGPNNSFAHPGYWASYSMISD
jgi:CHAT domain-containing protein